MRALHFLAWSSRRLVALVSHGIGLLSTFLAVILFFLPWVTSGLSRWYAVVPLAAYVILALLWAEWSRMDSASLAVSLRRYTSKSLGGHEYQHERIEIENCGKLTFENVHWLFPTEVRGWHFSEKDILKPWPNLAPTERISIPVSITIGADAQLPVVVTGTVDGREYRRETLLSLYS